MLTEARKGGITDGCQPHVGARNETNPSPLEEQLVLLIVKPSLQPLPDSFSNNVFIFIVMKKAKCSVTCF